MPFQLGYQKKHNPYFNCDNFTYKKKIANFIKNKDKITAEAGELEFFTFIREKRNKY